MQILLLIFNPVGVSIITNEIYENFQIDCKHIDYTHKPLQVDFITVNTSHLFSCPTISNTKLSINQE